MKVEGISEGSASGDSSKENKDNSQLESEKSEKSNNGPVDVDVDMANTSHMVSSPAPSLPPSADPAAPVIAASA